MFDNLVFDVYDLFALWGFGLVTGVDIDNCVSLLVLMFAFR